MTQYQRLEKIVSILSNNGFAKVAELARKTGVSQMTIRRDLDNLSASGLIERYHGGARYLQNMIPEIDLDNKSKIHNIEKKQIASKALEFIADYDTIFLDAGTTTFEIANLIVINRKPVSVVTIDLNIAAFLCDSNAEIIMVGGEVQKRTRSTAGSITSDLIRNFRFAKAFLGAPSIDKNFHVLTPTIEKAYIKRAVLDVSTNIYLVVDTSKFFSQSRSLICHMREFSGVITNRQFSKAELRNFVDLGINIIDV